jgi:hypothetical protein
VLRVLVAVGLAVSLLAVSLPAVDHARTTTTADRLDGAVETTARSLHAVATDEDATRPALPGARRLVTVSLPTSSWTAAPVAWFAIGGVPGAADVTARRPKANASTVVAYRVAGGDTRRRRIRLPGVAVRTPAGPVVFRSPGRHHVRFALTRTDRGPTITVTRE